MPDPDVIRTILVFSDIEEDKCIVLLDHHSDDPKNPWVQIRLSQPKYSRTFNMRLSYNERQSLARALKLGDAADPESID